MADTFTETTTRSWSSRIGGSFKGILFGLVLIAVSFPLLWWNEGRAIDRAKTLAAGRDAVVSITPSPIDPANEGALVHLSGLATTRDQLSDDVFGVSARAIKLKRSVEMYQWTEEQGSKTTKNLGGSETTETTYSYERRWSDTWVDSSRFRQPSGHENPASMPYESQTAQAARVTLGAFALAARFVSQMDAFEPLNVAMSDRVPAGFSSHAGGYYRGSPASPQIGDIRVAFAVVDPMDVSAIGRQRGDAITTATMARGSIALLEPGLVDADAMFDKAETANRILTWLARLGGVLLMWLGFALVLGPLKVLADVVPFIGTLVGAGTGFIAALLALALGLITIAVAWVFYRPILAAILLGGAVIAILAALFRARRTTPQPPPPPQAT
ncbi:TMEM43 family protein [Thiorhodococcus minor]|uniref:Uncharacterized protein n=1 Tax=Thiorhodococcus minor TaxID=57489 RepID=A0A6M0JW03_9GAMM|nr:TMEM43 family protein [Thiorhodococcus minor]NEV61369.1 hypothetical protein [Thiorhodococcus minor]